MTVHQTKAQVEPPGRACALPQSARAYLAAVTVAAAAAAGAALSGMGADEPWLAFALLGAGAAVAQLLVVPTGRNHGFHTALVFVLAAALLLPPELVALVGIAQHLAEGLREARPWYIQTFNVANGTLNALAAWGAAELVHASGGAWALGAVAGAVVLVGLNHVLLAFMLRFGRGHTIRSTGLLSLGSFGIEVVPAALGIVLAYLWTNEPLLAPLAVAPVVLAQRTFVTLSLLRESEERFRAMFESAAVGAALVDLEGRIVSSNRALESMLGYPKQALVGRRYADLADAGGRPDLERRLAQLVRDEREDFRLETRYTTRSGGDVFAYAAAALVRNADGRPQYVIVMAENITERKELEEQLRQSQKMEAVGRLAGGIAHDFNNMLTAITGYADFSLFHLDAGLEIPRDNLVEIHRAADRAASLTRHLLTFSRKQVLQPRVLDLNQVLGDLEKMLRRLIGEDIDVLTHLGEGVGHVRADPTQLEQVVVNLAVNARDAMPNGGTLRIETASAHVRLPRGEGADDAPHGYVVLTVADDGCGMTEETKARVFEPFYTTKKPGEGTGLGLSTVYGVVTQSGGHIAVESSPGAGTTFRINLPRLDAPVALEVADEPADGAAGGAETILLVEDDEIVRKMLAEVLRSSGYTAVEAANASDALRVCDLHRDAIKLVVTDVVMPGMSGFQLAEELSKRVSARILFMSGYAETLHRDDHELDASLDFLQKPFSPQHFVRKLAEMLEPERTAA